MIDLPQYLLQKLLEDRESTSLHPSTDILGCLRSAQLRLAGDRLTKSPKLTDKMAALNGTAYHKLLESIIQEDNNLIALTELVDQVDLPGRWNGRPDWLVLVPSERQFQLWDLKTVNSLYGFKYVQAAPKDEHIAQISAYWHGLADKIPLTSTAGLWYLCIDVKGPQSVSHEVEPLDKEFLWNLMEVRDQAVTHYLEEVAITGEIVNNKLAGGITTWQARYCNRVNCACRSA